MAGGRLIFPRLVEVAHLVTSSTTYEDGLREPALERASPDDRIGRRSRAERIVRAPAQVSPRAFEMLRMSLSGYVPDGEIEIVFHWDGLMDAGLIGADGDPLLRVNDRLHRILSMESESVIFRPRTPPGLYIVEVMPSGFGFGRDAQWNLLKVRLQDREVGADR